MQEQRFLLIIDCWHCPYHYESKIGGSTRRCAFSSRNFEDQDDYGIPKWCQLPGKI